MARKLEGTERGLDALVGVVVLVAELLIGFLALTALFELGTNPPVGSDIDTLEIGFAIAAFGSIAVVGITTIVYLVRIAVGRRSWTAPFWGTLLMTVAVFIGYFVMASA